MSNDNSPYGPAPRFFWFLLWTSVVMFILGFISWKFIAIGSTIAILVGLMMIATVIEQGGQR